MGVSRADFPLSPEAEAMALVQPVTCGKQASARQGEALIWQMGSRIGEGKKKKGGGRGEHTYST